MTKPWSRLNKAAEVDDPDGVILEHLADCQRDAGKTVDAIATYERAVKKLTAEKDDDKAAVRAEETASTAREEVGRE